MNYPLSPFCLVNQPVYPLSDQTQSLDYKKPQNKTEQYSSVSDFFQKQLGISKPIADKAQSDIEKKQKVLRFNTFHQLNESYKFPRSDDFPFDVVITKKRIHIFHEHVAVGTSSEVHKAFVLTTSRHQLDDENFSPLKVKVKAVKQTRGKVGEVSTYTPEKNRLSRLQAKRGLDLPEDTFKQPDGHGYSMHNLFEGDLTKLKWNYFTNPGSFIFNMLMEVCQGLKNLHDAEIIHRDIKGANIVIKKRETDQDENFENASSVDVDYQFSLTDFGLAKPEREISKKTAGTEEYLDPALFGSLEDCLVNQKIRPGLQQTKEHDIYALGITLFRDVLLPLIKDNGLNHRDPEFQNILNHLKIKTLEGHFNDQDLREHGKTSNYRTIYRYHLKKNIEYLTTYPEIKIMSKYLKEAIYRLNNLSEQDKDTLINLSDLCCLMQAPKEKRPTIDQVMMILEKIKEYLLQSQHDSPFKRVKADLSKIFNGEWQNDLDLPVSQAFPIQPTQISLSQTASPVLSQFPQTQLIY